MAVSNPRDFKYAPIHASSQSANIFLDNLYDGYSRLTATLFL